MGFGIFVVRPASGYRCRSIVLSPAYKEKKYDYRFDISPGYLLRISKINFTKIPNSAMAVVVGLNQQWPNCWAVRIS